MRRMLLVAVIATLGLALLPSVSSAGRGADVDKAKLRALPAAADAGLGDVDGWAKIKRGPGEQTRVQLQAKDLDPNTRYVAHLHKDGCLNGHYKDDPDGAGVPPNELWLSFTTNAAGNGHDSSSQDWVARSEADAVVIHLSEDTGSAPAGSKVACALF